MKLFVWVCFILVYHVSLAQSQKTYTIKPGENIYDVLFSQDIYSYPDFTTGTVIFRDGRSVNSRLNYNILVGSIQFIDGKGDTLSLAEENTIRYVVINKDSFCYDNGYIKLVADHSPVKLGKKIFFEEFEQKPGSYGLSSGATAAVTLTSILERRQYDLNTKQELVLRKNSEYVFGNKNEFLVAEKKNLLKLFPKYKNEITAYLNNNPINFKKEEDLLRLATFLQSQ